MFKFYSIGHFINQPNSRTEFEIMRFETMTEPDVDDVHKHTFYEILWIEEGLSQQTIDYQAYETRPNSLFFISPNQVHEFEEWQPLKGGSILFTEDFFLLNNSNKNRLFEISFLDNFYANPCVNLSAADFVEVKQTIDLILREHYRPDRSQQITQSLLHILLEQVQRAVNQQAETQVSKRYLVVYKQFKELLDQHFEQNKTASFFAEKLNLTQHHLNLIVKAVTNRTASEVIKARSTLEAKRLLTFTDLSISEIATRLNYFDSSYFSKVFKSETSQSPSEFKIKISEKYRR
jgi:AraC family transcriptional regulator, transcriptional activator of pobA